ncbi:MAG: tetratricopeptide repeat protein [Actinomycetota bacterium]|nr:tetratricopeptide repeat protein [Actinomycetota bacterium]
MSSSAVERERLYDLAREAQPHLGSGSSDWLERLEAERTEIEDAISSYVAAGDARGAEMATAVWQLWFRGGHMDEGRRLLARVIDSAVATSPEIRADLLGGLGTIAFRQGDNDEAARIFGESLTVAETLDPVRQVGALCNLGRVALRRGDFASVRDYALRAYGLAETIPGAEGKAARRNPAHMLAAAARMAADYAQARRYYEESQDLSRELGNEQSVAGEHHNLGYVDLHSGDLAGARSHFRQALEWVAANRDMYLLPYCVVDSAILALRDGALDRAATLLAAAQAIFDTTGAVPDPDDGVEIDGCRRELEDRMNAGLYEAAVERGRALTVEGVLELAVAS